MLTTSTEKIPTRQKMTQESESKRWHIDIAGTFPKPMRPVRNVTRYVTFVYIRDNKNILCGPP